MIFADLKLENKVQVSEKLRLDASKSFTAKDSVGIAKVEIRPDVVGQFYDVTGSSSKDWFLDWAYATDGEKTVRVRITTDGEAPTISETDRKVLVLTEAQDNLLSTDSDLISLESDIMDFLPEGKNSFHYAHRKARDLILEYLDKTGYTDKDGARLGVQAFIEGHKEEFRAWSKFLSLRLIFFDLSNQLDDIYMEKSKEYRSLEENARSRVRLPLDLNGDGEIGKSEQVRFDSIRLRVR